MDAPEAAPTTIMGVHKVQRAIAELPDAERSTHGIESQVCVANVAKVLRHLPHNARRRKRVSTPKLRAGNTTHLLQRGDRCTRASLSAQQPGHWDRGVTIDTTTSSPAKCGKDKCATVEAGPLQPSS